MKILHLSDMHMFQNSNSPQSIDSNLLGSLLQAVSNEIPNPDLVVITGDIYSSSNIDNNKVNALNLFLESLTKHSKKQITTIIVPGNHDCRKYGVSGPHNTSLLSESYSKMVLNGIYLGKNTYKRIEYKMPSNNIPLHLLGYDSTYLPYGKFSAGGIVNKEDLLDAARRISSCRDDCIVMFATHHHLIPTPVTDESYIDMSKSNFITRFVVRRFLPWLISNADREELTMTALGAGSVLSTLHTFGRPILVLHGHKHYSSARLLSGLESDEGDVLLISAGSAGTVEKCPRTGSSIWPSFNIVEINDDFTNDKKSKPNNRQKPNLNNNTVNRRNRNTRMTLQVSTVAFSPTQSGTYTKWTLAQVRRQGRKWITVPIKSLRPMNQKAIIDDNIAKYILVPNKVRPNYFWDMKAVRMINWSSNLKPKAYVEVVQGAPGAIVDEIMINGKNPENGKNSQRVTTEITIPPGQSASYTLKNGVCRTAKIFKKIYPGAACVEWVGLLNRYPCKSVELEVSFQNQPDLLPDQQPFGSSTDLITGRERPLEVTLSGGVYKLVYKNCPARTLLLLYIPLL